MDLAPVVSSDAAILFFGLAGLLATTVAILVDTRHQAAELVEEPVRMK